MFRWIRALYFSLQPAYLVVSRPADVWHGSRSSSGIVLLGWRANWKLYVICEALFRLSIADANALACSVVSLPEQNRRFLVTMTTFVRPLSRALTVNRILIFEGCPQLGKSGTSSIARRKQRRIQGSIFKQATRSPFDCLLQPPAYHYPQTQHRRG